MAAQAACGKGNAPWSTLNVPQPPEINVKGNNTTIASGDTTSAPANGPACGTYTNRTTANGLDDNYMKPVRIKSL